MGKVSLDRQHTTQICDHCHGSVEVICGSVYENGQPCGLNLIGMHHCGGEPAALLAVALLVPEDGSPQAVHLRVHAGAEAFHMGLVEPKESPWGSHHYLGRMLAPNEARESPLRGRFFHVADHVVEDLPEVQAYLSAQQ